MGCPGIRRERRAPGKMLDDRLTEQIRVPSSRQAARETGRVLLTAAQLAALVSPDRKRLVEICNGLPGVKPVAQSTHRKIASKRIRKVLRKFGEPRGRPVPWDSCGHCAFYRTRKNSKKPHFRYAISETNPKQ